MRILVTLPVEERHLALLRQAAPDAAFDCIPGKDLTPADVADREIILGNIPTALLPEAKALRWLQLNSAGTDGYNGRLPAGALLTNATGAYGLAISEHLLAMLLCLQKKLYLYRDNQRQALWRDEGGVASVAGARALIVGVGNIGGDFARKLQALGAECVGVRRKSTELPEGISALYHPDQLDELLPGADIVALCLPGTAETRGMLDARRLALMKKTAILLNVGRGTAVDTLALNRALREGALGGAGLDVTDPEPLPPEHPLWSAPNCVITPHVSGFYHLQETFERIVRIAAANLARYEAGEPLQNLVDPETGYRRL